MATALDILTARELRAIEPLVLLPRKSPRGQVRGVRQSKAKGVSIEFSDNREYAEGDDLRHLDWNILARLGTPVMKVYHDEQDLQVHLLVDRSKSMETGSPSKRDAANRWAQALSMIALNGGDSLTLYRLGETGPVPRSLRGRQASPKVTRWLQTGEALDATLSTSLRAFGRTRPKPGIAILITDGLDPSMAQSIQELSSLRLELWVIQILSPQEVEPELEGDLRLVDVETNQMVEITANRDAILAYKANLAEHQQALRAAVTKVGGRIAQVTSATPIESILTRVMIPERWVSG